MYRAVVMLCFVWSFELRAESVPALSPQPLATAPQAQVEAKPLPESEPPKPVQSVPVYSTVPQVAPPASNPPVYPQSAPMLAPPQQERQFKIIIGPYYSFADQVDFEGAIFLQSFEFTIEGQEDTEAVPGVKISVLNPTATNLALEFGVAYDFEREIKSGSVTINGVTTSGTYTDKPKMSLMSIFGNFRGYASPEFYVFGGINLTKINLKNSEYSIKTGFGLQGGLGYSLTPQVGLEMQYRYIFAKGRFSGVTDTGQAYSVDIERFEIGGLITSLQYTF